jgi:hypothetical protein
MTIMNRINPPMVTEDQKKKLSAVLKELAILPVRNGEVSISIGPSQTIGNIKIITNTG